MMPVPRCVNCSLALKHPLPHRQVAEASDAMLSILSSWIHPTIVTEDNKLCLECFVILQNESITFSTGAEVARAYGHPQVCLVCGKSIMRAKTHPVPENSSERNVIVSCIPVHQINRLERVCLPCWTNIYRTVRRHALVDQNRQQEDVLEEAVIPHEDLDASMSSLSSLTESPIPVPPPLPTSPPYVYTGIHNVPKIISRTYKRAAATSRHCIFPECQNIERLLIPSVIKEMLLLEKKMFVPISARICLHHLNNGSWNELSFNYNDFTGNQMDDMMLVMEKASRRQLDFFNIREMNPHLCHYWLGINSEQFHDLLSHIPQLLNEVPCPSVALSIILVKLRTGETNERLSTLFNLPRSTLERYMTKARNCLTNSFVPLFLGLGCLSIQDVALKNKIIPEGLFGNPDLPEHIKPAIVICDGTYIYVQSSSNYLYQKKTYSLHKYCNLVKPFLFVCCDGTILQSLGPFPATESDSDIMSNEFRNENSTFRNYFRRDDVFILDRGFRDVIGQLHTYGYKTYMPESLLEGENQLTTEQANRSRCVTMCRWVVEVVNGRIKRDFKLFRQEYFNRASTHLMSDFNIACALLNKFHQPIQDRPDAHQFLEIAQTNLNTLNHLGEYVINENINRRRAIFILIDDATHSHLESFPKLSLHELMTVALGSYQVKQARSYYGEHVRRNGKYEIEVANDTIEDDLPLVLGTDKCLLRGRIKSRHVSSRTYYAYILYNRVITNSLVDIAGYYCSCLVGKRTVGCCAHVMTILWYLSWARYRSVSAPASFLDDIFYEYDDDDE